MKSSRIVSLIILFPLLFVIPLINEVGFLFSSIYFFVVVLFCWAFLILLAIKNQFLIRKENQWEVIVFIVLMLLSIVVAHQLRYSKPTFFLFVVSSIFVLSKITKIKSSQREIKVVALIFFIVSCFFIPFSSSYTYDGRYIAFLISPTVFSVYIDIFLILSLWNTRTKMVRLILVCFFGTLVYLTGTRINLLITAAIPVLFWVLDKEYISKRSTILIFISAFVFVYPLYQYSMDAGYFKNFLLMRYTDGRDASFDLRSYLNAVSFEIFQGGTLLEKLFGHGNEYSRLYVSRLFNEDTYPHNDFLRLLNDFGIIFTALYIGVMAKIALKSNVAVVLFVLYLSTFYHNMVFDFFLPCLIILFSYTEAEPEQT